MQKRLAPLLSALALLVGAAAGTSCVGNAPMDQTGSTTAPVEVPQSPSDTTTPSDGHSPPFQATPAPAYGTASPTLLDWGTTDDAGTATVDAGTTTTTTTEAPDAGTTTTTTTTTPAMSKSYQAPSSHTTRTVASSNAGGTPSVSAYSYTLPSGATTIPYPIIDLHDASQFEAGTFSDTHGVARLGYKFTIAPGNSPDWGGAPRVEFDSASGSVQNPADGAPNAAGWNAGVITAGHEMWFVWSMYLDSNFALNHPWAELFQLHPGNTNWADVAANVWPNPGWPGLGVENDTIAFGMGPDATSPGQVWTSSISSLRGKWVDLAFHAKFSTGSDGLMELYVNGQLAGSKTGSNMVYQTTNGTPPWYYLKQGYYRDATMTSTDTVYQTPIMVTVIK